MAQYEEEGMQRRDSFVETLSIPQSGMEVSAICRGRVLHPERAKQISAPLSSSCRPSESSRYRTCRASALCPLYLRRQREELVLPHTSYLRRERFRCGVLQAAAAHDKLSSNEVGCAGSLGSWSSLLFVFSGSVVNRQAQMSTD